MDLILLNKGKTTFMDRRNFLNSSLILGGGTFFLPFVNHKKVFANKINDDKMKTILHKANTRGSANHGWLKTNHTFSFASYYDPERMHFGKFRVLNDDIIKGGYGFGTHPHDNMEIITIPLEGAIEHKDSMNHISVIREGDVQVMSAGTGVTHSEYNHSKSEEAKLLQLWIFPRNSGLTPRYDQVTFNKEEYKNTIKTIVNPDHEGGLFIHQDAWLSLSKPESGKELGYKIKKEGNGLYIFVIEGEIEIGEQKLSKRDGLGIWNTEEITFKASTDSYILFVDVPMR
jgi:redox-sensitive bicupin YhaK (pirin superfamily)